MNARKKLVAVVLWCAGASAAFGADPASDMQPRNVVHLSATASVDVRQNLLTLTLAATREGAEPGAVQSQLKDALDGALALAKDEAAPGRMEVHSGNFALYPRYDKDGRISTWQGRAELVLEGRDLARIGAMAGRIRSMTVSNVTFGLSREQRSSAQDEAQAAAIENYRVQADRIAKSFGFGGWSLREATVQSNDLFPPPRPRMRSLEASAATMEAPVPVEAGSSTVTVTVSGSVQLKQ